MARPNVPNDSSMPHPHRETEHNPNAAIVLTPRVAGEEPSCRNQSLRSVSPTLIREILEKSGMALKVPNFFTRAATQESVRDVYKAKFKPRPCSPSARRQPKIARLKSSSPGLVTVPVSAKQWLLQALGLKDSEIYELFHQMESMPQFAAEYVREVKDEWQALESREAKKPPEAEYLSKDQALLEKVRGLILRFARAHEYEELMAKQQGSQVVNQRDNNGSCSRPRLQSKSPHMQGEKNMCDVQDNGTLKPDQGILISEIDEGDAAYTTQSIMCSSCRQVRSMSDAEFQRAVPATNTGPREFSSQPRHTLPSFIPVDDYVVKQCVVQPELHGKVDHKSRFSPLDKRWYTVLFPALQKT